MKIATELLINAFLVSKHATYANYVNRCTYKPSYNNTSFITKPVIHFEFILNNALELVQCAKLHPASAKKKCIITEIPNYKDIYNQLFEINHVRVNPNYDNTQIVETFTKTLTELGVPLHNQPNSNSLAICFKPLGEIKETVRFYIKDNNTAIFLANTAKPKLIYTRKS